MKKGNPESHGLWWPSGDGVDLAALFKRRCHRAVLGMTQTGKSTWLKSVVMPALLKARQTVFCLDVHDEYSAEGKARSATSLGPLEYRVEAPEFRDWLRDNQEVFTRRGVGVSIVPVSPNEDGAEIAEQIAEVAPWFKHRGDCHVFFEELAAWGEDGAELTKAVATGWLKDDVQAWFIAQGYRFVPIDTRTQLEQVYSFRQVDRADLRFLRGDCGRGYALAVANLDNHHFRARDRREVDPDLLTELGGMEPPHSKEK